VTTHQADQELVSCEDLLEKIEKLYPIYEWLVYAKLCAEQDFDPSDTARFPYGEATSYGDKYQDLCEFTAKRLHSMADAVRQGPLNCAVDEALLHAIARSDRYSNFV